MKNFQNLDFVDYLRIVYRRIWYLIVPVILISAGTVVYVSRMPSQYVSTTTITVAARILPDDYIGSMVRESSADRIDFVKQQLNSRTFLERIVQEFQMAPPGANVDDYVSMLAASKEVTAGAGSFTLSFRSSQPELAQRVTQRLAERVMQLNDTFRKERVYVADQFLEEQVRQAANEMAQSEEKVRDFYQKHFPGMPQDQNSSLQILGDLERERAGLDSGIESINTEKKLLDQRRDEQRKFKNAMASRAPAPSMPAQIPTKLPSRNEQILAAKLDQLAAQRLAHTDDWPDIRVLKREIKHIEDQIAAEKAKPAEPAPAAPAPVEQVAEQNPLPALDFSIDFSDVEMQVRLDSLAKDLRKKQDALNLVMGKIGQYQRRVNAPPEVLEELAGLQRERQMANQRYELMSSKKFSSDLAGRVDTDANNQTFKVIDAANLPIRPFAPDRPMLMGVGFLASIAFGFVLVFVREYLDPTLGDVETAASALKLPVFAAVPNVRGVRKRRLRKLRRKSALSIVASEKEDRQNRFSLDLADDRVRSVILDPRTISGEQYRVVRAQLSAMQRKKNLTRILIASGIPNEGKTFSACCLAGILAQEPGKKVLLIDADLRTASVSHILGIGGRRVPVTGLSDVLRGSVTIEESLIESADLNNWSILPSGTVVDNPTELLSAPEFEHLMYDLSGLFDWIIVDSPPVLALADADLLLRHCDGALLVVNADKTPLKLVKDSLDKIGRERICGVLMNRVRAFASSSYYYSRYYRQASVSKK